MSVKWRAQQVQMAVFAVALVSGAGRSAEACSCPDEIDQTVGKPLSSDQVTSRRIENATDVVRGKVVAMSSSASERAMAVHGKMQITKALKGSLSGGLAGVLPMPKNEAGAK